MRWTKTAAGFKLELVTAFESSPLRPHPHYLHDGQAEIDRMLIRLPARRHVLVAPVSTVSASVPIAAGSRDPLRPTECSSPCPEASALQASVAPARTDSCPGPLRWPCRDSPVCLASAGSRSHTP